MVHNQTVLQGSGGCHLPNQELVPEGGWVWSAWSGRWAQTAGVDFPSYWVSSECSTDAVCRGCHPHRWSDSPGGNPGDCGFQLGAHKPCYHLTKSPASLPLGFQRDSVWGACSHLKNPIFEQITDSLEHWGAEQPWQRQARGSTCSCAGRRLRVRLRCCCCCVQLCGGPSCAQLVSTAAAIAP